MKIKRWLEWIAFAASSAVILYGGFAAFDYVLGTGLDNCVNAREAPVANERGARAERAFAISLGGRMKSGLACASPMDRAISCLSATRLLE
jgi:hypothetical protein